MKLLFFAQVLVKKFIIKLMPLAQTRGLNITPELEEIMSDLSIAQGSPFDSIRRVNEDGQEFWYARELMPLLGYRRWDRVPDVIERAMTACKNARNVVTEHFTEEGRKSPTKPLQDFRLSRYAAYLVAMNGDPRKEAIAQAQSYFAIKAREAELQEQIVIVPKSYGEALLEAGRLAIELEKVAAEKALIEQANYKLEEKNELLEIENGCLTEENEVLSEAVDELFEYSSIIRIAKFNNVSEKLFKWQTLKAASIRLGVEIKRVPCQRYEYKNLYSQNAWRAAYPGFKLPETTTLVIVQNQV